MGAFNVHVTHANYWLGIGNSYRGGWIRAGERPAQPPSPRTLAIPFWGPPWRACRRTPEHWGRGKRSAERKFVVEFPPPPSSRSPSHAVLLLSDVATNVL